MFFQSIGKTISLLGCKRLPDEIETELLSGIVTDFLKSQWTRRILIRWDTFFRYFRLLYLHPQ